MIEAGVSEYLNWDHRSDHHGDPPREIVAAIYRAMTADVPRETPADLEIEVTPEMIERGMLQALQFPEMSHGVEEYTIRKILEAALSGIKRTSDLAKLYGDKPTP